MGVILDSSAIIAGERKGGTVAALLTNLRVQLGQGPIAISTVTVVELEHGIWRAKDAAQSKRRQMFLEDLFSVVPAYPLTFGIARRAARIDGEAQGPADSVSGFDNWRNSSGVRLCSGDPQRTAFSDDPGPHRKIARTRNGLDTPDLRGYRRLRCK